MWADLLLFFWVKVVDPAPVLHGEICSYFKVKQVDPALVLPGEILFAFLSLSFSVGQVGRPFSCNVLRDMLLF